ncbi:MAG: TatD family hydrolase [Deltaproteobacteria bacterium]|nr:TatD family hydrolase [Deltaproteobacteria bacterium]
MSNGPKYFDTHVHLDMLQKRGIEPKTAIENAISGGVTGMIAISGSNFDLDFETTVDIVKENEQVYMAAGYHPHNAADITSAHLEKLKTVLSQKKCVALGEIGLDYFYNHSPSKEQRKIFIEQIKIAREFALPVIIHTRNADDETITIIKNEGVGEIGGVLHCFSSGEKLAMEAVDLGMYISFSGIITFPKSESICETAKNIPAGRILCETDSPYLSPVPHRGKTNEPLRVKHVVEKVASVRDVELEQFSEVIIANTEKCFNI